MPDDAPVVCIVGGNGTGKSQILELIAACAQRVGLSPGVEHRRGDPFSDNSTFEITFFVSIGVVPEVENSDVYAPGLREDLTTWDRTLVVGNRKDHGYYLRAGKVRPEGGDQFAHAVVQIIQQSKSVHYLSLDADRSYHKVEIQHHELGQVFDRDWDATNKQSSFRITKNLYDEWFRFLIGSENQQNNKYVQSIRIARDTQTVEPIFIDQFEAYKDSIKKVLPHLLFIGINPQTRQINFNSTGLPLTFDQLSGGEREIAFLIGQIERFGLKKGLMLVDEPELHLNYDLLRSWIGFLKDSVELGQIWLASHSLEVVEVTGRDATIVLQRNEQTRKISGATRLSDQPVMATLSRAVGSPCFSISNLAFVWIEGEEEIGERERLRLLCNIPSHVRFLEAGSCKEVIRKVSNLKELADVSGQQIRLGGIIDRDWRPSAELKEFTDRGIFILGVHEIENLFIHPDTVRDYSNTNGQDIDDVEGLIRDAADERAGTWIFDGARTDRRFREYPEPSKAVRELVHRLKWQDFSDIKTCCSEIANAHGEINAEESKALCRMLEARAAIYGRKRVENDLWMICEGKEVSKAIFKALGLADRQSAERAMFAVWKRRPDLVPNELSALRTYVNNL